MAQAGSGEDRPDFPDSDVGEVGWTEDLETLLIMLVF